MRFEKLLLTRFGPFTDALIDFGPSRVGLHIVYGPNEAGKSSSLRAVQNLLFGIPGQSPDNFQHHYKDLRIGGVIRDAQGQAFHFIRKKGNKQTLLDEREHPLPDDSLTHVLSGHVDQDAFQARFGIDHERLREGGQEIANGQGDVGELLFSAGGVRDVRKKLDALTAEREDLLRSSGRGGRIHELVASREDLEKKRKSVAVSVEAWELLRARREDAQKAKDAGDAEIARLRTERERRRRYHDAVPMVSQRTEQRQNLEKVLEAVDLPEDFPKRRIAIQQDLAHFESTLQQLETELQQRRDRHREASFDPELLRHEAAIEELNERRANHVQAQSDRGKLEFELAQARRRIEDILKDLNRPCDFASGSAEWDTLRIPAGKRAGIQELANHHGRLVESAKNAVRQRADAEAELSAARRELERIGLPGDPQALAEAVRQGTRLGNPDDRLRELDLAIEKVRRSISRLSSGLPLWSGDVDRLVELPIPAAETIERFRLQRTNLDRDQEKFHGELADSERRSEELRGQLRRLESDGAVPSEEDLEAIRTRRNAGWQLIRRQLLGENVDEASLHSWLPHAGGVVELADAYDALQRQADELSDRLRREADAVARKQELNRQFGDLAETQARLQERQRDLAERRAAFQRDWDHAWAFLGQSPLPPDEMAAWSRKHAEICRLCEDRWGREQERRQLVEDRDRIVAALSAAVTGAGGTVESPLPGLQVLLDRGEALRELLNERRSRRQNLEDRVRELESRLEPLDRDRQAAQSALEEWKAAWAAEMERLGLDPQAGVAEAQQVLERLGDLGNVTLEAAGLEDRIRQIDKFGTEFQTNAESLLRTLGRATDDVPTALAVRNVMTELNDARQTSVKVRELTDSIEKLERQQTQLDGDVRRARESLAAMCREASVSEIEALSEAEKRSDERRRCLEAIKQIDKSLRNLAHGTPLEDFVREVQECNADALGQEIRTLDDQIKEQDGVRSQAIAELRSAEDELKRIDGRDDAVRRHAEDCEQVVAAIEEQVRRYLALTVAAEVLRQGIEAYRQRNEGPILSRASELFATLTCGSFVKLRADFDEKDNPILVGVRGGTEVFVTGMSDGTRDQLYLALRIASLEHWLAAHPPIPFLIDDVLVTFDDTRAAAALQVLAELSRKTQVIFFTHHEHLLEVAKASLPDEMFHVHSLRSTSPYPTPPKRTGGRKPRTKKRQEPSQTQALFEET